MNIRDLDLNLLVIFDAVYTQRNITRAADGLDMSQPAISNAIGRLRKQMDDPLFVRKGNGVVPTMRADAMAVPVREALAGLKRSLSPQDIFDVRTTEKTFKLAIADPLETTLLSALVHAVGEDSRIAFELKPIQTTVIDDALMKDILELAVFPQSTNEPQLQCEALCPLDLVIIARRGHPGLKQENRDTLLSDYGHVTLNLRPGVLANSERVQFRQRVTRKDVCIVNRLSSAPPLVEKTDLLSLVPRIYAEQVARNFDLQIIEPEQKLSDLRMFMTWHKRYDDEPAHRWLRRQISEAVERALMS